MVSALEDASRLLVASMMGRADQSQVEQQLLELSSNDAEAVAKAFEAKANVLLQLAGAGHFQRSKKAGHALVALAVGLDVAARKCTGKEVDVGSCIGFSRALLEAVIEMTGGAKKAPKDKAQRAHVAVLILDLVAHVKDHALAKATLLEYAEDKVPAIRNKALQGLSHMIPDGKIQSLLKTCSMDNDRTVRTAAVASMSTTSGSGSCAALLSRLDDTDASVRQALFNTLANEPEAVASFEPCILARLIVGLHDRSQLVRDAARNAVPKWVGYLGGPIQVLGKCDIFSNEFLAQDCADQLSQLCQLQSAEQSRQWLRSGGSCFPELHKQAALLTRYSLGLMSDDERDHAVDIPVVLKMTRDALSVVILDDTKNDFLLRQLLHILATLDFCDEALRRNLAKLTVEVLSTAPVSSEVSAISESGNRIIETVHTTVDLGILVMRKCFGFDRIQGRRQAQEILVTERVMQVIGDVVRARHDSDVEPQCDERLQLGSETEPHFAAISRRLEAIAVQIADLDALKGAASDAKASAIQMEDFEEAHYQKEELATIQVQLQPLKDRHAILLAERDGVCHRVLAIVSALLKWTNSDIRKDGVLLRMLSSVVRPILKMQALSEEVNLRALHAICLYCSLDVELALNHWDFLTRLLTNLGELQGDKKTKRINLRRAMLAAATLSDCARLHWGFFDRDQVLSAASVLAVVPYESREVSIYPLCGWLMSFGAMYFEEHMSNPLPEITWALAWMLAEAFSNRARERAVSTQVAADNLSETSLKSQATDLMVFFNILAKHPGRHGEALLCLGVETIIESGLWRCAVSLPVDAHNQQFTRGFSWPTMFEFVRSRLSDALQLRLWRCCLQVCVTCPELAPWAQIPLALAAGIAKAPPGVAELVKTALSLGADADALSPIVAGLPPLKAIVIPNQFKLLRSRAEAVKAEEALVAELKEIGVRMSEWTPPITMCVPRGKPSVAVDDALRLSAMRSVGMARRGAYSRAALDNALRATEGEPLIATPARAALPQDHVPMEEADVKPRGMKRMLSEEVSKTNSCNITDID